MSKSLTLSSTALEEMLTKAAEKAYERFDQEAISITGCDIKCTLELEMNIRNGKSLISFKTYCAQNDINSSLAFGILRDVGYIEYEKEDRCTENVLTAEGFEALNGTSPQSKPMITSIGGNIYVDDTDPRFKNLIKTLESHSTFKKCDNGGEYNTNVKSRKSSYSRRELGIAKVLGVEIIKIKELPDVNTDA